MAEQPEKKNILDNAINILSSRDEKAALEAAKTQIADLEKKLADAEAVKMGLMRRADTAERRVTELEGQLAKSSAEAAKAPDQSATLQAVIAQLQQRLAVVEPKANLYDQAQAKLSAAASQAAQIMTTHTMTDKETLSDLSLKYYGHATKPYWQLIYEANKTAIGDNPNHVRPGTELKIPVLPQDMK